MAETILEKLADYARKRVAADKETISFEQIKELAQSRMEAEPFRFEKALKKKGLSFICEVKKASPSKGIIDPVFSYLDIAKEYEAAGADCISCLTEPKWFLGSDAIFEEIRNVVSIPMIRKDFTVDPYQIYQAKYMGADAVLLICAILTEAQVKEFLQLSDSLGLTAVVETHTEEEIEMAIRAGARVIGVNNRNLKDFSVDTEHSRNLRKLVPDEIVFVSESGISSVETARSLETIGVDAVLIGEMLMRAEDKKALIRQMKGEPLH